MAGSPIWKVYTPGGEYEAACKSAEVAAAVVAVLGPGATVRPDHGRAVWHEGMEDCNAGDSYDGAAEVMLERLRQHRAERTARLRAR